MSKSSKADWQSLDKDLLRVNQLELTTGYVIRPLVGTGVALAFIALAGLTAIVLLGTAPGVVFIALGAFFAAYLALNIGANDVAHTMGPAVGAGALSMTMGLAVAAIAETAGALIGGGEVVATISQRLIAPGTLTQTEGHLTLAMVGALVSSALWVNFANWIGAPVSTTHSVVGSVVGGTAMIAGWGGVDLATLSRIASAWMVAPLLGAAVAVALLALARARISRQDDKIQAARIWVPIFAAAMISAFTLYLSLKLPSQAVEAIGITSSERTLAAVGIAGAVAYSLFLPLIRTQAKGLENREKSVKLLFRAPLVVAATLMCFAHGANDVANAAGPLAAVVMAAQQQGFSPAEATLPVPFWVALISALGLLLGVILFGPRLIQMVGGQITKLNPMRSFCVASATAIIVILASWQGLPLSTTHVAVGAIFGIGFYREYEARLGRKKGATPHRFAPEDRSRRRLVRRSHFMTIIAAWVITLPASGVLAAMICGVLLALT